MKLRLLLFTGLVICLVSPLVSSYEPEYGAHHAYPVHHHAPGGGGHQGWGAGHQAGSYYHYHVPLVGQQQQPSYHPHYHPPQQQDNHLLWLLALIPLLLLGAAPLLLIGLLPLLLIPIGIALLALLMPMMMMMMMMMMASSSERVARDFGTEGYITSHMRTIGELLMGDVNSIFTRYSRSLDLDKCPERVSCEIGSALFPINASRTSTAKVFMSYVIENAVPKGKAQEILRNCREALFEGSKSNSCSNFQCQPTFRLYEEPVYDAASNFVSKSVGQQQNVPIEAANKIYTSSSVSSSTSPIAVNSKILKRKILKNKSKPLSTFGTTSTNTPYIDDYYNQYLQQQQQYVSPPAAQNTTIIDAIPSGIKTDRILQQYSYYDDKAQDYLGNELRSSNKKSLYSRFATPVVRI